jgi:DNA-binding FadR family transcriptional regulator
MVTTVMDRDPDAARDATKHHLEFAYESFREFQHQAKVTRNSELYSSIFDNKRSD